MIVHIFNPLTDTLKINGFTIVVDVFRAFSVAYYINENHPDKYIVVDDVDLAFDLKRKIHNSLLVGERGGIKISGFDFGNSPTEILGNDFTGKTIIHTTSAGTKGLLKQPEYNEVIVGSFVNSLAILKYSRNNNIDTVNIYCTSNEGDVYGEEDYLFAEYLKNELLGKENNYPEIKERLMQGSGKGFNENGFAPFTDFMYCMDLNRFDKVLKRSVVINEFCKIELVEMV